MFRFLSIASVALASLLSCPVLRAAPESLPADYKNYEMLDDGFSPDKNYGVMCIKREVLDESEDTKQKVFLVAVAPFHVLTEIPVRNSDLLRGHSTHVIQWTPDGSTVLLIEETKWGPDKVFLVPIHHGQAGKIVDLTAEVEQRVRPDYRRSGMARFNDFYDFIFEDRAGIGDGFALRKDGQVDIDCLCTTDPKHMENASWSVRFHGVWSVAEARMTKTSCKRMKTKTP